VLAAGFSTSTAPPALPPEEWPNRTRPRQSQATGPVGRLARTDAPSPPVPARRLQSPSRCFVGGSSHVVFPTRALCGG
jgi:hypothetical protein